MVRFFLYSMFHGKSEPTGSDYIRAVQLIKYWDEAGLYKFGEFPDVLIFNKVFMAPDYQFPKHFENITILDICDPMWFEGQSVVDTCQAVDAVTCPTQALAEFIRQFHKNVVVIPDRFDIARVPEPKLHTNPAKTVVWFGYSHNIDLLKPAIPFVKDLGLELLVISNENPQIERWGMDYKFIKYDETTIYEDLQLADMAILPDGFRPADRFKSNNREIKANLAGLPVAKTPEDLKAYMDAKSRLEWFDANYATIKAEYDVKHSIEDYKSLINKLSEKSANNG